MTTCKRCVLHTGIPGVVIGEDGVCNYCVLHDEMEDQYPLGWKGRVALDSIYDQIKQDGSGHTYDCIIGISGGCDSSYTLAHLVDHGINPLAVHWNNNWNTRIAQENIESITKPLGVDVQQYHVNQEEYDDLCLAFLKARVPDADIPNDIALTKVLYQAAELADTRYIINAHSFRTEGTTPLGWSYMDGGYIIDVNKKYGSIPLKTYPNLTYEEFKHYIFKEYKRIRPLYYLEYNKAEAIRTLQKRFKWKWYGGHHLENNYTIFIGSYIQPRIFDMDLRYVELSALTRSLQMHRQEALNQLQTTPSIDSSLLAKVFGRLGINRNQFDEIMETPRKSHHDYETYRARFKEDYEFFKLAYDRGLIPATFYRKYCEGV